MKGRPPKPQGLRNLTGIQSKRPKPKEIASPQFDFPTAPDEVGEDGRNFWNKIGKSCHSVGVLFETDLELLTIACQCYDRRERARIQLGDTLIEAGQFGARKHPLLLIIQQEEDRLSKYLQQFGMSPVARERVNFNPRADREALTIVGN
ncbi:phage terminase small subunit P27 family [bacterium]|nr:phage terminase small subunit P27 family [bacterium]